MPVTDTPPAIRDEQIELLRAAGDAGRWKILCDLSQTVRDLSRRAILDRHPEATERERARIFVEIHYGEKVARLLDR